MSDTFDIFGIIAGDARIPVAMVPPITKARVILRLTAIIHAKKQHFTGFQFQPFREWAASRKLVWPGPSSVMASSHYPDHLNLKGFDNDTRVHVIAAKDWGEGKSARGICARTTVFLTSFKSLVDMTELYSKEYGSLRTVEARYDVLDEVSLAVLFGQTPEFFDEIMKGLVDFVDEVVADRRKRFAAVEQVQRDVHRIRAFF